MGVSADRNILQTVKINPVLKLLLPDTACVSIAWGSHARLAAGCDNGETTRYNLPSLFLGMDKLTFLLQATSLYGTLPKRWKPNSRLVRSRLVLVSLLAR